MTKFIERALRKLPKLDLEQIRTLILDIASEKELFEIVLQSMTDGVVVLDTNHTILLFNKSAERLLPFRVGDLTESVVWETIDDAEIASFFHRHLLGIDRTATRDFALDGGGSLKILSCSIMPLVRNDETRGNLIHIEDITERRSNETRLRRAENLASLTTLTAGVAHEIKNPLGSIGIHIQLIQKSLRNETEPDVETIGRYLDVVNEEIDRLNGIVVDFLFAVRPMDCTLERKRLGDFVEDTLDFVRYELDAAHIRIETQLAERLPNVDIDEKYMKQALLNIIKNAISAMPDGGVLTVSTRVEGNDVLLMVSDTGVGIPEENIAKIFEPYFTTKEFGSGLGLTLVYKIVKEHGGEISLTSREGEGTTFTISFPVPQGERNLIAWGGKE
jgi:two-component system, sporulation sensor kinase E